MFEIIYSLVILTLTIAAFLYARVAMERGLTYTAMSAIVWTLVILAGARLWHTLRAMFDLHLIMGRADEYIEYTLYFIAYAVFVGMILKSFKNKK